MAWVVTCSPDCPADLPPNYSTAGARLLRMSADTPRTLPATDLSDGICAYLQGGLGNQLFILAAAWAQAVRLDCPLYIDRSRFIRRDRLEAGYETARNFDLGDLDLPGTVLAEDSPWFANSPRRPAAIRIPGRRSHSLRVFREPAADGPSQIDAAVRPGTTLFGYFQSPHYFGAISSQIVQLLESARISSADRAATEQMAAAPKLTVHLRRGDYLRPDVAAHHGMVSTDYVRRALDLLEHLTGARGARVFTDSPAVVEGELAGTTDVDIVDPDQLGTLATILAMSRGTGFIMSNSSFSWWAAYLLHLRDGAPIVAPRPWTAAGDAGVSLLLDKWLTLGAR